MSHIWCPPVLRDSWGGVGRRRTRCDQVPLVPARGKRVADGTQTLPCSRDVALPCGLGHNHQWTLSRRTKSSSTASSLSPQGCGLKGPFTPTPWTEEGGCVMGRDVLERPYTAGGGGGYPIP